MKMQLYLRKKLFAKETEKRLKIAFQLVKDHLIDFVGSFFLASSIRERCVCDKLFDSRRLGI